MTLLIDPTDVRHHLDLPEMDETHLQFIDLVNRMADADKPGFIRLFAELIEHTDRHFSAEYALMRESRFPAIGEHGDEHRRILGEMTKIGRRVASGSLMLGRAYIKEQLPGWFALHAMTMDSALAAHLKSGDSPSTAIHGSPSGAHGATGG
jgi:hemerythrin-like metal-binding protein